MKNLLLITTVLFTLVLILGCSSGNSQNIPVVPGDTLSKPASSQSGPGEYIWGLFDMEYNPESNELVVTPLRSANYEANILMFLEGGAGTFLTVKNLIFEPPVIQCDMLIKHPFPGATMYTGFMVRGVVLTDGTLGGFTNPDLIMSDVDELRLENYDGFTRWMNPVDFPNDGSLFSYRPGKMGDPSGDAYKSTLNPYKLFADSLSSNPDDLNLNKSMKAAFTSEAENSRHYILNFGSLPAYKFQYAIVASHENPLNDPPVIPDDFPLGTVASEPYKVEAFQLSTPWNDGVESGGVLKMQVEVSDFENAETDIVYIESKDYFPQQSMNLVSQNGITVTYELEVADLLIPPAGGGYEIFITAVAPDGEGYNGLLSGEDCALWTFTTFSVSPDKPPVEPDCPNFPFYDDFETTSCVWTPHGGNWWGVADGQLDAKGGTLCYEEDTGSPQENPNLSYVSSPVISIPESDQEVVISFEHTISVDPPEWMAFWAWDACFVRVNGELIYPTAGPAYEACHYPLSFEDYPCWTGYYDWHTNEFNIGTAYNGTDIEIEFVLDTFDYIDNCLPPYFGWLIDNVSVEFTQ